MATALHQGLRLNTGWVYLLSSHSPHPICLQNLLPLLGNKPRVQSLLTASTGTLWYQTSVVSTLAYCSGSRRLPFVSCLFQCSSSQLGVILASGQGHVFGFHNWGKGCYRHLVSGGQKCCWRSSNGQDRPLQQRTVWIKRSVALRLKIFALPILNTIAQGDPTKTDIKSCHVPAQQRHISCKSSAQFDPPLLWVLLKRPCVPPVPATQVSCSFQSLACCSLPGHAIYPTPRGAASLPSGLYSKVSVLPRPSWLPSVKRHPIFHNPFAASSFSPYHLTLSNTAYAHFSSL